MTWSRRLLAVGFVVAGVLHFLRPESYIGMVPSYLPAPRALVLISGAAEIAGGLGLAIPRVRWAAGWFLVALLVVVFPANLDMALHPERHSIPEGLLWARLPLQGVLIWWVHRAAAGSDVGDAVGIRRACRPLWLRQTGQIRRIGNHYGRRP